jgi:hypothetical protein
MNRADIAGAKNIGEIGGHGGKAATIHRRNDAKRRRENADGLQPRKGLRSTIAKRSNEEKDEIGRSRLKMPPFAAAIASHCPHHPLQLPQPMHSYPIDSAFGVSIICASIDGFMAAGGRPDVPAGTKTYALGGILDSNMPLGCGNHRCASRLPKIGGLRPICCA